MVDHQLSFHDYRCRTGRGGPRPGAGRPRRRTRERRPSHDARPLHSRHTPVHATLRVRQGLPSLRCGRFLREFRAGLLAMRGRSGFRVCQCSVQGNHLHLIVEAEDRGALSGGMKALGCRVAAAVHRAFGGAGAVLAERCHLRALRTPAEVRAALAYVLLNVRKHAWERLGRAPRVVLDGASSARFFDGWRRGASSPRGAVRRRVVEVSDSRCWLLRVGWRRHGALIDPAEVPGR